MTSSAQLEREAEQTRSQLAQTLDELRERITPGQLVDQAVDYAKDSGGGLFVRNLGRQTTANPLPVALIGAGVAWLMLSNGRRPAISASINRAAETAIERARQSMTDAGATLGEVTGQAASQASELGKATSDRMRDWASNTTERFREMADNARSGAQQSAEDARSRASQVASSMSDTASSAFDTAKSRAGDAYDTAANRTRQAASQMSNTVAGLGQRTAGASRDLLDFCKSQPLVLAGIGMALGAIIGALIPATETEDQLIGGTSDQLKDQASEAANDQYEKAKDIVKDGLNQAEAQFNRPASEQSEPTLVPEAEQSSPKEPVK